MPITQFNDLRNPYSVNQPTSTMGVDTGTGFAVIVRLKALVLDHLNLGGFPMAVIPGFNGKPDVPIALGYAADAANGGLCEGDPNDPSWTAFISYDDYVNSDMQNIAASFLMWEEGQNILYMHENMDYPHLMNHGTAYCSWEIIEVVDEATYNNGAGVPQGDFITQATYGEIPVGTITANPSDPNSNGASTAYDTLYIPQNQGLPSNNTPGFLGLYGESQTGGTSTLGYYNIGCPYDINAVQVLGGAPCPAGSWNTPTLLDSQEFFTIQTTTALNPTTVSSWRFYSRGFYIGTYAGIVNWWGGIQSPDGEVTLEDGTIITHTSLTSVCKNVQACRNPLALNYDTTTTSIWQDNYNSINSGNGPIAGALDSGTSQYLAQWQDDCAGVTFDPNVPTGIAGYGDQSGCIFPPNVGPGEPVDDDDIIIVGSTGCIDSNLTCGCMNPNAVNYDIAHTYDCNNILSGLDESCCTYYHTWFFCGGTGLYDPANTGYTGPFYINLVGSLPPVAPEPNTPDGNHEFMEYYIGQPGSPFAYVNDVPIGTMMVLRSMGMPGNYMCMEYIGPANDTAVNLYPGNGGYWDPTTWWNNPVSLDGSMQLLIPEDCASCLIPPSLNVSAIFQLCDTDSQADPIFINLIAPWASDPMDEQLNSQGQPGGSFSNDIDASAFGCSLCNQTWMLQGQMVLEINPPGGDGTTRCFTYMGYSMYPEGDSAGGWIEGMGPNTDNFFRLDPDDPTQLLSISDNCDDCTEGVSCTPTCTDPNSSNFVSGPWSTNQCDCNGDSIGTNAIGWNSCCYACDGLCNDPVANNYDPNAEGCCGSGAGIGVPIVESGNAGCANIVYSGIVEDFAQFISEPANSLTGTNILNIGFEDMSTVLYGGPIPVGGCNGVNGGFNYAPASGFNCNMWSSGYMTWDLFLDACITGADSGTGGPIVITGITATSTLSEAIDLINIELGVSNVAISIIPIVCLCSYANYADNYDCCTYNWRCIPELTQFNQNWPDPDTQKQKNQVIYDWNKRYPNSNNDFNPRPHNGWNHTEDIGYVWPGLEYLNISLRYSPIGNLGFNRNIISGNQGWATGKQPKINQPNTIDNWRFATDFMDDFTGSGAGSKGNWDKDLGKSYYKVKTNMISVAGTFTNPGSKLITELIIGGTQETGLYYLIIPTGLITIKKGFEAAFPNTSGKEFKTWRLFIESLIADGLPNTLREQNWTIISQWVLSYIQDINTINPNKEDASPEFVQSSMTWMVQSSSECICILDPNGPYINQSQCETMLNIPGSGGGATNCCACIYGCTDPNSFNYDPLASCDDGSCVDCDPFILRICDTNSYNIGFLCNTGICGICTANTPQNCTQSALLLAAWGFQNYGDIVSITYEDQANDQANLPNCNMGVEVWGPVCFQWVSPNDPDYLDWVFNGGVANNTTYSQQLALPNSGLTLINTSYDGISYDSTCNNCGDNSGCTDPNAMNYDPAATVDDGSCVYCVYGCMDGTLHVDGFPDINGHGSNAMYACDTSTTIPFLADLCPFPCATGYAVSNFLPCATCDDGSCDTPTYHQWKGCVDEITYVILAPGAPADIFSHQWFYDNVGSPSIGETIHIMAEDRRICYEYLGSVEDPSLIPILTPRPLMVDWYYSTQWNIDCETCSCIYGCTDITMCNYDPNATCDDGSCCNLVGCLDPNAFNYCPTCCCDGPCTAIIYGCMDPNSENYDPTANTPCENDCCFYIVNGCIDPLAVNFNPLATVNDGSCTYLDQCKRELKEYGSNPTKKLDVECSFASDVYKEYRKERYGLSNYCGSDLPDHLHEKALCDWEDSKRPAYLSSTLTVLDTYCYPIVDGLPDWFDPLRPTWTNENCGLSSDVEVDMYFAYDTTSMGLAAIQNQRMAIEDWLVDLNGRNIPFGGQIYHTLVLGERWLDWGTSVFTGVWNNSGSCGGFNSGCVPPNPVDHGLCNTGTYADAVTIISMSLTHRFWLAVDWGNTTGREWFAAMPDTVTNGTLHHSGFPPPLAKREVLSVNFADESAATGGLGGTAQPYHYQPGPALYGTTSWKSATDGTGTFQNGSDSTITPCWKADYDEWISVYQAHLAKGADYKATMVIYPAKPIPSLGASLAQTAFPLHVLGGVDSGNNLPQDGRYGIGTAPSNGIANLKRIEEGNPYWDTVNPVQPVTHTFGYGGLDNYGWQANVRETSFDADTFKEDLEGYWDPNRLKCDDSECIVLNVVNQNNVAIPNYDIYVDGGFVGETDEYGRLLFTIPNASVKTDHIINLCLCLVTTGNCCQQNIKITVQEECAPECCTDPFGVNCDTYISPGPQVFEGCMDPNASNYNPMATIDDGSCEYCDPPILLSETHVNVSAAAASDGSINITVTNGTLPYTYAWSNGETTQDLTGLPGGLYTLTVTDANDCDSTIVIPLNEDPDIYGCRKDDLGYWPNINGLDQAGFTCTYPCSDDGTSSGIPEGYKYFCYDPDATIDRDCCEAGCTDNSSTNWCPSCNYDCNMDDITAGGYVPALGWDSCCDGCIYGCTNPLAGNFDPLANCDDGSCIFYFDCTEATWQIDEVTGQGYTLSNVNTTGIFNDTTCAAGSCDSTIFFAEMAIYYSTPPNQSIITASELTIVNSTAGSNNMGFLAFQNDCPACNMNPTYSCILPVGTIGGYTTINPYGPTGANSCYAAEQLLDFPANYIFPTWAAYRDWHNNGTNTSNGPNTNCAGFQIPIILASDNITDANTMHNAINGGGSSPGNPDPNDNWIYWTWHVPQCSGFEDCKCERQFDVQGTYETEIECLDDVTTCCGEEEPEPTGGCIDNGFVGLHADFGTYGASTEQEWWEGQNASGISYAQNNNPMSICNNGIVHEEAIVNGGGGSIGSGMTGTYPIGIPAYNYNPLATFDDGSCCYCSGCMDVTDINYEVGACIDDPLLCGGTEIFGCTDPNADNYSPTANIDDFSCQFVGCMDASASNYLTFEINGLTSYWSSFSNVTYGLPSIQVPCSSCCINSLKWGCVSDQSMIIDPSAPTESNCTLPTPNYSCRQDVSMLVNVDGSGGFNPVQGPQTLCGTAYGWSNNTSLIANAYDIWGSNDINMAAAADWRDWFFWLPTNNSPNTNTCTISNSEVDALYVQTGWESPDGTAHFKHNQLNPNDATVYPSVLRRIIQNWSIINVATGATVYIQDGTLGSAIPHTWAHARDFMLNTLGFDGNTYPDITGLNISEWAPIFATQSDYTVSGGIYGNCKCTSWSPNDLAGPALVSACYQGPLFNATGYDTADECIDSSNCRDAVCE